MKKARKSQSYTYTFPGTKIYRDTTALPFADGGPLNDRNLQGELLQSTYASPLGNMFREGGPFGEDQGAFDYAQSVYAPELGNYYGQGGMLKRADGSYSQRGLWDNIRANTGSGKKPTKEMLAQEKKINRQYKEGGPLLTKLTPAEEKQFQKFYQSLPDNLQSDDATYDIRGYWDSEGRPEVFNFNQPTEDDGYYHAYSISGNTGEYLKSPAHETFQHAVDIDRTMGYRPITNVQGRNIVVENESIKSPEERSFLANTQGPVNFRTGGQFPQPYSLPEDSFRQGGRNLHNSVYASSNAQYPAVYNFGGTLKNNLATRQQMYMPLDHITRNGGSILSMSNTPQLEGEGKDLTVPENSYYYTNGGNMNTPWLHNLYGNGGGLFDRLRARQQAIETPVQNLPEVTVYGNSASAAQQKSLMLKLEEMQRAFSNMRKDSGYGAGRLDTKQKGSIAGLKHNIQIYKKALEEQKLITAEAQKALNVLKRKDPENWGDKTVRDVIENPQAVNSLRALYDNNKISEGTFRDFYETFGKWTDLNVKEGNGRDNYSAKEAREKWGKSEHWQDIINKVHTVATAIPLTAAGLAFGIPGHAGRLLANPWVQGGLNAYGFATLPYNISQAYKSFKKGNFGTGAFQTGMAAFDVIPAAGGYRYVKNFIPGFKNVIGGRANVSDLFKPADLMQLRKEASQKLVGQNKFDQPTMGMYYGRTNDINQIPYWPTKKVVDPVTGKIIEKPLPEAYMRTKLGGTKASVADKRIDNLESEGLWTSHITNPDGTLKSDEEIAKILSDLHKEDDLLKLEKANVLKKIQSGYKNNEFIGRVPLIEARQKSIYKLLDDAAAYTAPKQSVPRPDEFNDAIQRVLTKGINGKKVDLSGQDIDMLRYISDHHHEYFSNPEIRQTVDQIFTEYPHIKDIKESKPFSSQSEYIFPVGKKPPKISYDEFLKSMNTHDDRAVLNNYLRRHPDKKYSPYVLATEANIARNRFLNNSFGQTLNVGAKVLPYTNTETIPYFGYKTNSENSQNSFTPTVPFEDELYNLGNINTKEADAVKTYIPNPWKMPKPNIMSLSKLPPNI
jgi:hypothetical protein